MRASVLIINYNYGRFLQEALESALGQTYSDIEVVVVDDGSTDDSREILASYGERIRVVLQENAGQRAALNAAFAASTGEIACLLDSDDVFVPRKVERVIDAFRRDPAPSVVYHQLQSIDAGGARIGNPMPRSVLEGDIRPRVERAGGWWPRPTSSALSFPRTFLERVLPMPTERGGRHTQDTHLVSAAPWFGPVVGLAEPLALFRLHGSNDWSRGQIGSQPNLDMTIRTRRDQYRTDFEMLQETLRTSLRVEPRISLADHLRYQQHRRGAGEPVSLAHVVGMALRCPTLPWPMRWREAVKIALGRW